MTAYFATGVPCPVCGQARMAQIVRLALPQMELRCTSCGWDFAIESAYVEAQHEAGTAETPSPPHRPDR